MNQPALTKTHTNFDILGTNAHKAQWTYDYAISLGLNDYQGKRIVSQLHRENGTWEETRRGDKVNGVWCSVGIIQWNECARGKLPVAYTDWQGQIKILVNEVKTRYDESGNFYRAQVGWNNPRAYGNGQYKTVYYYDLKKTYTQLFN